MAEHQHYVVATAGHVDHGKSALVNALTGTDPDRLPDEKARGITIDLGFAHLELPAAVPGTSSFLLGIVDVPGHEDFVKNMVAGVGSIDLALFVVAADDEWMPQTEEHLQILTYLGVSRAVVALTKIDLTKDKHGVSARIREKLSRELHPLPDHAKRNGRASGRSKVGGLGAIWACSDRDTQLWGGNILSMFGSSCFVFQRRDPSHAPCELGSGLGKHKPSWDRAYPIDRERRDTENRLGKGLPMFSSQA